MYVRTCVFTVLVGLCYAIHVATMYHLVWLFWGFAGNVYHISIFVCPDHVDAQTHSGQGQKLMVGRPGGRQCCPTLPHSPAISSF